MEASYCPDYETSASERGEMVSNHRPSGSGHVHPLNLVRLAGRPPFWSDHRRKAQRAFKTTPHSLRRDKIGFVFQFLQPAADVTCLENVGLPLHLRGLGRARRLTIVPASF